MTKKAAPRKRPTPQPPRGALRVASAADTQSPRKSTPAASVGNTKSPRTATKGASSGGRWKCPRCGRFFTQVNQRHACGTGDREQVLRNRPDALVRVYDEIESFAKSLGPIEIVARDRYVLLRSVRIFADLVMMTDAVRVAIHLQRRVGDPIFFKVVSEKKKVTHVAKLQSHGDFLDIKPYLQEAYEMSVGTRARRARMRGDTP